MVRAEKFLKCLDKKGFGPYIGVPCSFLKPFINYAIQSKTHEYLAANNEGEAIAIATGAYLAGKQPVVMMQNSGLGNCVNPLTSLNFIFKIPLLLIVSLRGEPGFKDEPQHELMGRITGEMLNLMGVEYQIFPTEESIIEGSVNTAVNSMNEAGLPYAFMMKKNSVKPVKTEDSKPKVFLKGNLIRNDEASTTVLERREAIEIVSQILGRNTLMVSTTGKISRELYTIHDRPNQFYVVGSMGCASSIGLGLAYHKPDYRTVILDGDGAALMRLESWVSIGHYRPANLICVVFDNESYESTGGQDTLSSTVRFDEMAVAAGFSSAVTVYSEDKLLDALQRVIKNRGPHMIQIKVKKGSDVGLGRPTVTPVEVKNRFMNFIEGPCLNSHSLTDSDNLPI